MVISTKEQHVSTMVESCVNFDRRTIYIMGEADPELAHRVIIALEALDKEPGEIRVFLNSEGGNEEDGYAIYDALTMCVNPVRIEGYGNVCSIAAAIFQAGDVRLLSPNATFMIHNGTVGGEETMQQNQVIDLADQLRKNNQKYYDILSAASQQPQDVIETWCREEKYFTAEEAVQAGFADQVIVPLKTKGPIKKKRKRKTV